MFSLYRVVIVDDEGIPRRILSQKIEKNAPRFCFDGRVQDGRSGLAVSGKRRSGYSDYGY